MKKTQKEAFRVKGALWNAKQSKNHYVTTIAGLKKAKEKALTWTSQTGKELYKNHSEKYSLQNAKKNNKATEKKSSDRRRPS